MPFTKKKLSVHLLTPGANLIRVFIPNLHALPSLPKYLPEALNPEENKITPVFFFFFFFFESGVFLP